MYMQVLEQPAVGLCCLQTEHTHIREATPTTTVTHGTEKTEKTRRAAALLLFWSAVSSL